MASNAQKILGIGTPFYSLDYIGFTDVDFHSATSFMDYDAVVINTRSLALEYGLTCPDTYNGKLCLPVDASFKMKEDFARTRTQIIEFLKQGKNVFVVMTKNEDCYIHTGESSYSGTGKNARKTNFVAEFDVFSFLPIKIKPTFVSGRSVNVVCRSPYSTFFQATKEVMCYEAFFTAPKETTLLTMLNSDKAVSAAFEYEKGKIIILPSFCFPTSDTSESEEDKYGKIYLDALFELNHSLMSNADSYSLPLWTDGIKILAEEDQEKKLEQDLKKLENIKAEIATREALITKIRRKKILLAASGTTLEEVVKETLQEIGFALHEAEVGRSDIIASYEGVYVVAEIKGVSKSAAEKHAAQLEKWVAQFMEEKEHSPKALLIVNGYCDTPLSDRTEEVFPDQMLKYCKSREHALITTTQLLCLYIEIKNNPACAKERITEMLSCVGKYSRYLDYEKYLRLIEKEEDKDNV